ncbi:MAG: hypothetical protein LRY27_04745 [Chitinophagales bacterium]|nr:hypothetical protein [Chitinophagales bacterium]
MSIIATIFIACNPLSKLTDAEISIEGTSWEYSDEDWTYQIKFGKNGKLISTHPNDNTPDNDTWNQSRNQIHFEFNDGFSKYDGKMETIDLIIANGENTGGTWECTLKRVRFE